MPDLKYGTGHGVRTAWRQGDRPDRGPIGTAM